MYKEFHKNAIEKGFYNLDFEINRKLAFNEMLDPFAGLFSTAYKALQMKRKAIGIELNPEYFSDGDFYIRTLIDKLKAPTLFDMLKVS